MSRSNFSEKESNVFRSLIVSKMHKLFLQSSIELCHAKTRVREWTMKTKSKLNRDELLCANDESSGCELRLEILHNAQDKTN